MTGRTVAHVASAVFREAVRDRVLYNLVGFAVILIGASLLARAADGRTGREDRQGSGPGRDVAFRVVHRRVHRHRSGVEGSGAADDLQPAGEAGAAIGAGGRQIRGAGADGPREPRRDGGDGVRSACVGVLGPAARRAPRVGGARHRPAPARRHVPRVRRAGVGHCDCAVLLHLHWSAAGGGLHHRPCSSPDISAPTCSTSVQCCDRQPSAALRGACTTCCPTSCCSTSRPRWCMAGLFRPAVSRMRRHTPACTPSACCCLRCSSSRGATFNERFLADPQHFSRGRGLPCRRDRSSRGRREPAQCPAGTEIAASCTCDPAKR